MYRLTKLYQNKMSPIGIVTIILVFAMAGAALQIEF